MKGPDTDTWLFGDGISQATGGSRLRIVSLIFFYITGLIALSFVDEKRVSGLQKQNKQNLLPVLDSFMKSPVNPPASAVGSSQLQYINKPQANWSNLPCAAGRLSYMKAVQVLLFPVSVSGIDRNTHTAILTALFQTALQGFP